jgi:hypothetical protein
MRPVGRCALLDNGFMSSVRHRPVPDAAVRAHRPVRVGGLLGGLGVLVLMIGTFLPWLASGAALRNSYQAMAVAGRLTPLGEGATGVALTAWPAVGGLTAALLMLYVVGLRRTAAVGISLLSVLAGAIATAMVVALPPGDFTVRAVWLGPAVTAVGAAVAVAGAVTTLATGAPRRAGGAQ